MKSRSCPVCGKTVAERIANLNFLLFDGCSLHGEGALATCLKCGAVYYTSANEPENYRHYYAHNTNYLRSDTRGMGTLRPGEVERYTNTSRILRKYVAGTSHFVTDVGCGQGGCLRTLAAEGWTRLVGVDPQPLNVEAIRQAGLQAEQGFAEHIPLPDASCSALLLCHVLEHFHSPRQALAEVRRVLTDDGILYLEVPDAAAYPAAGKAPFCDCIHEHINHFDAASMQNCLAASGFAMLEHGLQPLPGGCGGDVCLYAVCQKKGQPLPLVADFTLAEAMKLLSNDHRNLTVRAVERLAENKYRAHLWGLSSYGLHIAWLVAQAHLELHLYDASPVKQAHTVCGKSVADPDVLMLHWTADSRLLVPYSPYQEEIIQQASTVLDPGCIVCI